MTATIPIAKYVARASEWEDTISYLHPCLSHSADLLLLPNTGAQSPQPENARTHDFNFCDNRILTVGGGGVFVDKINLFVRHCHLYECKRLAKASSAGAASSHLELGHRSFDPEEKHEGIRRPTGVIILPFTTLLSSTASTWRVLALEQSLFDIYPVGCFDPYCSKRECRLFISILQI